jgi:hypothetical protein
MMPRGAGYVKYRVVYCSTRYSNRMQRRELRFQDFDQVLADADRLLAGGYQRAGNWSLAQVCDHLARIITLSLDGFPSLMPWPVRVLARWFALGPILRHKVFRRRFNTPTYLVPAADATDRDAVERLRAVLTRFKESTGPLHPSPLFGRLSRDEWREVHLWHCEHHFSFLSPNPKSLTTDNTAQHG